MLFDESIFGIPLTINWRWVVKVVADMKIIKTIEIIFVMPSELPKKVPDSGAPKKLACWAEIKYSPFNKPCGRFWLIPFRTVNRAKKIGAWAKIGKQDAKGFVL
jgi:hypothetical protein